jgi:hypothetical protein
MLPVSRLLRRNPAITDEAHIIAGDVLALTGVPTSCRRCPLLLPPSPTRCVQTATPSQFKQRTTPLALRIGQHQLHLSSRCLRLLQAADQSH